MATSKKVRNGIAEQAVLPAEQSPIITEVAVVEEPQLSRKEIITQMWRNAKAEIERIQADRAGIEQLVSDKHVQIKLLQQQRDVADDFYQTALKEEEEAAGRVVREQSRLQVAQGTPIEQERATTLQVLITALDGARKDVETALQARDEAHRKAELITVLREEIAEAQGRLGELAAEQREMEAVRQEQHRAYGIAERDEIRDGIEAARARRVRAVQEQQEAETEIDELQSAIRQGRLDQWRDLRDDLQASHGSEDLGALSATEKIVTAYIGYLRVIAENGHAIHRRTRHEKMQFLGAIDLNPGMMEWLCSPESSRMMYARDAYGQEITLPSNVRVDVVQKLLEHERRNRRSNW